MNKRILTAKLMNEKIKYGWSLSDLSEYFQVSEEEFIELLEKTFSSRATQSMIAGIKKNEKRKKNSQNVSGISDSNTSFTCKEPIVQDDEPIAVEPEFTEEQSNNPSENLDELILYKKSLCDEINELELLHKELVSTKMGFENELNKFKKFLLDLKEKISSCQASVVEISDKLLETQLEMEDVNSSISAKRAAISECESKIAELSKVNIFAYEDGSIEFEDSNFVIPDEWLNLFKELTNNESFETLTIQQIKQIAKLCVSIEYFKSESILFSITFGNSITQNAFESIF